jgi:hypothetical protein
MNMEQSEDKVLCNGDEVPVWIVSRGSKMFYDRPAYTDDDGGVPLGQMRSDECIIAPGAIYRKGEVK